MSDVGNIYYKGFENLFGGAYGQRKMTGRGHSSGNRNTRAHPHGDPEPQPYRDERNSNELQQEHYKHTNDQSYQNLEYNTETDSNDWGREEESNYYYYDHGPTIVENNAEDDLSLNQHSVQNHEHTSSEAPADYDYSIYGEYVYVPNYLLEEVEDDFR